MDHGICGRRSRGRCLLSSREVPPALSGDQQAELKAAVPRSPSEAGINLSNWNWKAVRQFVSDHFGLSLSRSSCLNYLHRLGFVLKRPKKRLRKADPVRRAAFVGEYAALTAAARQTGVKIFFADEAHFRADGDLRGKWVLKGEPALVGLHQPVPGREGQLLLGGVPGDRRGEDDGTGGQQQLRHLSRLPAATEGATHRNH